MSVYACAEPEEFVLHLFSVGVVRLWDWTHMWRSENTLGVSSLLVHVVPGIELIALGLTAGVITHFTGLLARRFCFFEFLRSLRIF